MFQVGVPFNHVFPFWLMISPSSPLSGFQAGPQLQIDCKLQYMIKYGIASTSGLGPRDLQALRPAFEVHPSLLKSHPLATRTVCDKKACDKPPVKTSSLISERLIFVLQIPF